VLLQGVASSDEQVLRDFTGTLAYTAPERFQGFAYPASDQYALGIVVYEWLAGERPFHGSPVQIARQHLYTPPPLLSTRFPDISPDVEYVVHRLLEKDPRRRFASVQEFADALHQAVYPSSTFLQRFFRRFFSFLSYFQDDHMLFT
jgi:serine/threonine protein kinase